MNEDEIIKIYRDCLTKANSAYSTQYAEMSDDLEFKSGIQYSNPEIKERSPRPCVVINQTATIIDDIVNPVRLNPFGIQIEGHDALQEHIRHIEQQSNSSEAFEIALDNAGSCGRGFVKVATDYDKKEPDKQNIFIRPVQNPLSIYLDPQSTDIVGADANWALELLFGDETYNKNKYGDDIIGDNTELYSGWVVPEGSIPCVNFYHKSIEKSKQYYVNGVEVDSISDMEKGYLIDKGADIKIIESSKDVWTVYKIIGCKVVDTTTVPIMPIRACYGDKVYIKDQLNCYKGVVYRARPVQKMINYYASQEMELCALAPKSPFVGSAEATKGYEDIWGSANTKPHSILVHNGYDEMGRPIAPPQRADNTSQTQSIIASRAKAQQDLEALFGRNQMNQVAGQDSGKAIFLKQQQSEVNTAQYIDNLKKCIKAIGEVVLEFMYAYYDTERMLGFVDDDGKVEYKQADLTQANIERDNVKISVSAGVAYESRRKEAISLSLEAMRMAPQMFPNFADLFYKQIDSPVAKEFAERAYRMLPPELQDDAKEQDPKAVQALQLAQQTLQETQMQAEEITNQLQVAYRVIDQLQVLHERNVAELKSENDIATQNNVTKVLIEYMKIQGKSEQIAQQEATAMIKEIMSLEGLVEAPQIDLQATSAPSMASGVAGGAQVPDGVILNEEMPL